VASGIFVAIAAIGGAFSSPLAALAPLGALLCGLAFTMPVSAFCAALEDDSFIPTLLRFGIMPMFLFAGTFFPIEQLPDYLQPVALITPLWHGVALCRGLATGTIGALGAAGHVAYLSAFIVVGAIAATIVLRRRLLT
jgi:lipooligosaccharide transport system permease protein